MTWNLNIRRTRNGFVISGMSETLEPNDEPFPFEEVLEELEDNPEDLTNADLARRICYYIIGYFGLGGSKHDVHRINITVDGLDDE